MGRKKLYTSELYAAVKKLFNDFHVKYHGSNFFFDTKNSCSLGEIINRIIIEKKGEYNEAEIINNFRFILYNMNDYGYIWENLSPALIVHSWNDVLKQARKNYRASVVKVEDAAPADSLPAFSKQNKQTNISDLLNEIIKI